MRIPAALLFCALMTTAIPSVPAFSATIDCTQQGCTEVKTERISRASRPAQSQRKMRHARSNVRIVAHPAGCPRSLFCGCGVSVKVFGHPVRNLYLADNWTRFPIAKAAPGMVGWRPGHVVYIEQVHGDGTATFYDPNSGQHLTRTYRGPLDGLRIVNPRWSKAEAPQPIRLASADPNEPLLDEKQPVDPTPAIVPLVVVDEVAEARTYLKEVAGAGGTMLRQGVDAVMTRLRSSVEAPNLIASFKEALQRGEVREEGIAVSIDRLHPDYAVKLAKAVKEARANGLPNAGPFSCYRPPVYRVGGMRDKAASCHAYGLVCDIGGIGWARSKDSERWGAIARRAGLYRPHRSAREHNHWQLVPNKVCGTAMMRSTITAAGPKDLQAMWAAGTKLASVAEVSTRAKSRRAKHRHHRRYAAVR